MNLPSNDGSISSARTRDNAPPPRTSKKKLVLSDIFAHCQQSGDYVFDNNLVKKISARHRFKNPFDATKNDNLSVLPEDIRAQGYCIVHLGKGKHKFIQAAHNCFHEFEEIKGEETPWKYRKSVLNEIDSSESNILSVGFNQRIVHDFLYDDIIANPKMYGSRRTKITAAYKIGDEKIVATKLQMEIDLIAEYQGVVTVFEGKNKFPKNFAVYQLYHPFLYFHQLIERGKIKIDKINCCYLLRNIQDGVSIIRMYLYTFDDINNMSSIRMKKCEQYRLIQR